MASEVEKPRIGLIGLGNAGGAMLQALSVHSRLHVYDRDPRRFEEVCSACHQQPIPVASAAAMAKSADLIVLSLPQPEASLSVAREIRAAAGEHMTLVECSTVAPADVEALHDILSPTGVRVIDAALVGGVQKLAKGQGVFLIGASEEEAGSTGAVFKSIAEEVFFLGERGAGMRTKLIVNSVAHVVYVALVEAGALAAAQDVPLSVLSRLLARESGLMRPLTHRFGERLAKHDFSGGMSTANALKDSSLILGVADEFGVPLFTTSAAHSVYELAIREGLGNLDYASIGTLWEKWLDISFVRESGE